MDIRSAKGGKIIRDFRPNKRPYIVFSICIGPVLLLCLTVFLVQDEADFLLTTGIFLLILFSLWGWLFHNRVIFSIEGVEHGRFLPFRRYLAYSEMNGYYTYIGFRDHHGRTGPFFRFVIEPKPDCPKKAIMFPTRIFAVADYRTMIELLSKHGIPELKGTSIVKDSVVKTLFARHR